MRGRKPLPTKMRIFTGNPGKRKLNDKEPQPDSGMPDPPKCLSKVALEEWKNISGQLHAMGILTKVDRVALAIYCQTFAQWYEAEEHINKNGTTINVDGELKINPNVRLAKWAKQDLSRFLSDFGLTPASRARLQVNEPNDGKASIFDSA